MNDDDVLRRALRRPTEHVSSSLVLEELRPAMRRARNRRRATIGATAALLLVGGGAGVLALTSTPSPTSVRTTPTSDEHGALLSTLPPVIGPSDPSDADTPDDLPEPTTTVGIVVETPTSTRADEDRPEARVAPEATPAPAPTGATPAPGTPPPTTEDAPAPEQPVEPRTQTLTSVCGDVVVEVGQRTVKITSITPLPGYTPQVSTDGPESVEMKFLASGDSCEVHAELKANGLDVEIQHSDHAG